MEKTYEAKNGEIKEISSVTIDAESKKSDLRFRIKNLTQQFSKLPDEISKAQAELDSLEELTNKKI